MAYNYSRAMQRTIIRDLEKIVGSSGVLSSPEDLLLYEYDGSVEEARPDAIVFPRRKQHVVEIVKLANRYDLSIVGRGAGTGLSGGTWHSSQIDFQLCCLNAVPRFGRKRLRG